MRWRVALLAVTMAAVTACDDGPTEPTVSRSDVAGTYDITVLAFDPAGSVLPERSLLTLLPPSDRPEFNVSPKGNTAQLVFRDPAPGFVTIAGATYRLREFGIEVTFDNAADAARILLPRRVSLSLDATASTLQFSGEASVPLARLQQLVPEWADLPLADPVPGVLTGAFTKRGGSE